MSRKKNLFLIVGLCILSLYKTEIVFGKQEIHRTSLNQLKIKRLLNKEDPIILELGSCIGNDTIRFLKRFKKIKIYSFEPDPRSISIFKNRIKDKRSVLIEAAVSNKDGTVTLNLSSGWPTSANPLNKEWLGSSSIKKSISHSKDWPWLKFEKKMEVKSVRLDTWIKENNITSIDFIWSDIQGAEKDMLEGAVETLKITKYLYTEYGATSSYPEALNRSQTIELLKKHDFELIPKFSNVSKVGNLLFRNKNLT